MTITNKKHAKVMEFDALGMKLENIAILCGYASAATVSGIIKKYGGKPRNPVFCHEERNNRIVQMARDGHSAADISGVMGLHHSTVRSVIRESRKEAETKASDRRVKAWSCSPAAVNRAAAKLARRKVSA